MKAEFRKSIRNWNQKGVDTDRSIEHLIRPDDPPDWKCLAATLGRFAVPNLGKIAAPETEGIWCAIQFDNGVGLSCLRLFLEFFEHPISTVCMIIGSTVNAMPDKISNRRGDAFGVIQPS